MKKNTLTRAQAKYFNEKLTSLEYVLHDIKTGGKKVTIPVNEIKDAIFTASTKITHDHELKVPYTKDSYCFGAGYNIHVDLTTTPTYKKALAEVQGSKATKERNNMIDTYQKLIEEFRLKLIFGTEANALLDELNNLTNAINKLMD